MNQICTQDNFFLQFCNCIVPVDARNGVRDARNYAYSCHYPPLAVKSQHHYKRTSTSQKEAFKVNLLTTGKEMPQITPLKAQIGAYFRRKLIY